jgi:hypothetical protein
MHERAAGGSVSSTDERDGSPLETTRPGSADGDDIVVITEPDSGRRRRRDVRIWVAAVIVVLLAGVVARVVFRGQANHTTVRTTSPTVALTPAAVAPLPAPMTVTPPRAATPTTSAVVLPFKSPPAKTGPQVTPAVVTAPPQAPGPTSAPPPTTPPTKNYGPSLLTWSAPHSMTVLAGSTAILAVAAHNRTDGTVTLPHPLSCAPRLDHGEICPEVVQVLPSRTSAGAQYTIDAHGIAPGHYSLTIEGVLTVAVTVRPIS